jgi:3-oxoacyl-[acyl-carrier protein] reductase
MPPILRRPRSGWKQRFLADRSIGVGQSSGHAGSAEQAVIQVVGAVLAPAGARVIWTGRTAPAEAFVRSGDAWAEPVSLASDPPPGEKLAGLVFDATPMSTVSDLDGLYEFFHGWSPALDRGAHVVVLARPVAGAAETSAARAAIEGFVRSLSKELGRKGTTANLIRVAEGAEGRLAGPLRFFLSEHSAFVTGQPLDVSASARPSPASSFHRALEGKVALITGASRGIGAETAEALAREGAHVVIADLPGSEPEASLIARKLRGSMLSVDVAASDAVSTVATKLRERLGGVDILVHNAGITRDKTLARMSPEAWRMVLDVNLRAAVALTEGLLEQELLRDSGRVVLLSSVGGIAGNVGQTNYAASKAGLIGYARSLSVRLAPQGITVNAIAPGLIETRMTERMPAMIREAARRLSSLNQGGLPSDVAEAVTFLAMPSADGCTGQVLRVCGGALIGA